MHILKAGTVLYHGTDNHNFEEDCASLDAYSWVSNSPSVAERFARRSGGWGGPQRVIEYRLAEDLALHEITSMRQWQAFIEEHNLEAFDTESLRDSARAAQLPGWVVLSNYPDGDDILIAEGHLLEYVGTTLLDAPAAVPTAGELEHLADALEACSGLLPGSAYASVRTVEKLFRHLIRADLAAVPTDGVAELAQELRHRANTVANPASARMLDAATLLERLATAGLFS